MCVAGFFRRSMSIVIAKATVWSRGLFFTNEGNWSGPIWDRENKHLGVKDRHARLFYMTALPSSIYSWPQTALTNALSCSVEGVPFLCRTMKMTNSVAMIPPTLIGVPKEAHNVFLSFAADCICALHCPAIRCNDWVDDKWLSFDEKENKVPLDPH